MIRVLLVDDELPGRIMVRSLIDWEKEGYYICGECSDGKQAWSILPTLKPQIVITDMKMNRMNGDELVRLISEQFPEICTIVLSGYDDYQYVRDVLNHHAVDYLIKNNLTPGLLLDSLHKAEAILKVGPRIEKDENNLQALRRQFVLDLISGELEGKPEAVRKEMKVLSIDMDTERVFPILLCIGNLDEKLSLDSIRDRRLIIFSVCNVLEELIREEYKGHAIALEQNEILILISFSGIYSEQKRAEAIRKLIKRGSFCLEKFMGLRGNFHVGKHSSLFELHASYRELEQQRKNAFLDMSLEGRKKGKQEYNNGNGIRLEQEQKITEALKRSDTELLTKELAAIFQEIYNENSSRTGCSHLFSDLLILSISFCKKQNICYETVYKQRSGVMEYVAQLENLKECKVFFQQLFQAILTEYKKQESLRGYSAPVTKVLSFIKLHYREGISLSQAAELAGMNSSYLSTLFKNEVGIGFVDYLNEIRLESAREAMDRSDLKMKQIIEQSGFTSYPYFFNLFKKKYNMTPKQYQRSKMKPEL